MRGKKERKKKGDNLTIFPAFTVSGSTVEAHLLTWNHLLRKEEHSQMDFPVNLVVVREQHSDAWLLFTYIIQWNLNL